AAPEVKTLSQPKRLALLTYLALEGSGEWVSRERIMGVFWPESTDERARTALRKALHSIRGALGREAVENRGEAYVRLAAGRVCCDVWQLREAVEAGRHERVLQLHRGDLLAGFYLAGNVEFEEWLELRRARLRSLARTAALRYAVEVEESGSPERVLRWARQVGHLFPEDEEVMSRVMRALSDVGERTVALEVFQRLESRLENGFGLAPSEPTRRIALNIKMATVTAEPPRPAPVRRTEAAVRASRAEDLLALVEEAPDALYRADLSGNFTFVNAATERITGYPREELLRMSYLDLVRADYREGVLGSYIRQQQEGVAVMHQEFPMVQKDGREAWVEQKVQLCLEGGGPVGVVAVARDVTARWLARSIERQRALFDDVTGLLSRPAFAFLLDHRLRIARRNGSPAFVLRASVSARDAEEGERAIVGTALALRQLLRDSDIVGRIAPLQIAVLTESPSHEGIDALLRRIETALHSRFADGSLPEGVRLHLESAELQPGSDLSLDAMMDGAGGHRALSLPCLPAG
ncbi:MAG TPA: PAS domain S-box protein, partial [Longimicrobiaceae bacterium]|nr:PAS domain S-box protein [Longimicrobiaceae bacterium]